MKKKHKKDTFHRAMSQMMSQLLPRYLLRTGNNNSPCKSTWEMAIGKQVPEGALVVPCFITDAKEWWLGWYRGKKDGAYLIESVETHEIGAFYNISLLYLNDTKFPTEHPCFRFTDKQYDMIDDIVKRLHDNNYWFTMGTPTFHEDGSIDLPIRRKFCDYIYTKTYKSFEDITNEALTQHCLECNEAEKNETNK